MNNPYILFVRRSGAVLLVCVLLVACLPSPLVSPTPPAALGTPAAVLPSADGSPTPAFNTPFGSLRQLSAYPLYELHYQGDYGFGERIRKNAPAAAYRLPAAAFACSCFSAAEGEGQRIMARNFDWGLHSALVLFTAPPGAYASLSMVDISYLGYDPQHSPLDAPERLKVAPYLPFDGMNERGLAVGMMAVSYADGGKDPQKVTLDSLELIRLMLDYAASVPEALELISKYNVNFEEVPIHYLVADSSGSSAVIEYPDGKPVILPNSGAWQVSTNFIISQEKPSGANSSCWRYNTLTSALAKTNGLLEKGAGMGLLQSVAQGGENATRWSSVYRLSGRTLTLAMGRDYQHLYSFSLEAGQ